MTTYQLVSVSKLWPDRVRLGTLIVHDDVAAIAHFNRTWADSPDLIRAELRRENGWILAGGARDGVWHVMPIPVPKPVAQPVAKPRSKPSRAVRRRHEQASR